MGGGPVRRGGYYCRACGAVHTSLPVGQVNCQLCGSLGLRVYTELPTRVHCRQPDCGFVGWDDGGVNPDLDNHMRREHPEVER